MVPKNLAVSVADRAALLLAPPLVGLLAVLRPGDPAAERSANPLPAGGAESSRRTR